MDDVLIRYLKGVVHVSFKRNLRNYKSACLMLLLCNVATQTYMYAPLSYYESGYQYPFCLPIVRIPFKYTILYEARCIRIVSTRTQEDQQRTQ